MIISIIMTWIMHHNYLRIIYFHTPNACYEVEFSIHHHRPTHHPHRCHPHPHNVFSTTMSSRFQCYNWVLIYYMRWSHKKRRKSTWPLHLWCKPTQIALQVFPNLGYAHYPSWFHKLKGYSASVIFRVSKYPTHSFVEYVIHLSS